MIIDGCCNQFTPLHPRHICVTIYSHVTMTERSRMLCLDDYGNPKHVYLEIAKAALDMCEGSACYKHDVDALYYPEREYSQCDYSNKFTVLVDRQPLDSFLESV